jgi:hypothetical protein
VSELLLEVPAGYRVGGWEVMRRIASGSWASVYAARRIAAPRTPRDPPEDAFAALKFLRGGSLSAPQVADLREAVQQEVEFNERADHPRLIHTFETLVVDDPGEPELHGAVVLAMEQAETSLQAALGELPADDAARMLAEVCEALVHLHESGWVHGDIKPSNVLVMGDGSVRLADFGLARELEGTHAYAPRLGSSDYLAPEWWTERVGERGIAVRTTADVWALGVTAHQLLTGGLLPFVGATPRARAAAAQAYAEGRTGLRLADELPARWRPLVADCLAPTHAARLPHTAASLLSRIVALRASGEARGPAEGRGRSRGVLAAIAAAATVAVGGGVFALVGGDDGPVALRGAPVRVFNAEAKCRHSSSDDCRLGLAGDPRATYGPRNVVGHARHGDRLVAECFVAGGTRVGSEDGSSSTRWYRVRTASGDAWLPGVRAWPGVTPAVGPCP